MGAVLTVSGIIGTIICGFYVEKTKKFKFTLMTFYFFGALSYLIAYLSALSGSFAMLLMSGAIGGFFLMSILPISLEFGCELSFPAEETVSAGILMTSMQIFGPTVVNLKSFYNNIYVE